MTVEQILLTPEAVKSLTEVMNGRCGCGCGQPRNDAADSLAINDPLPIIESEESNYLKILPEKLKKWNKIIAKKFKSWDDVTGEALSTLHHTHGVPVDVVECYFDRVIEGQVKEDFLRCWRAHREVSGQ